ncbi:hypothetical protein OJAV_G00024510 [Oryzias javanicus]|uniref:Uncharacterized protein n=1 Tax=Oryzias javanicus TaxID=123683 RepID=A0A437DI49_ORYJA|nr:hypothetical protein OJAV_G00024510 [Oryzias javanicus]
MQSCSRPTQRQHWNRFSRQFGHQQASASIPDEWAKGVIIKIPKKGTRNDCNNWQGITLLSIPSKILAKSLGERPGRRLCRQSETSSDLLCVLYVFLQLIRAFVFRVPGLPLHPPGFLLTCILSPHQPGAVIYPP